MIVFHRCNPVNMICRNKKAGNLYGPPAFDFIIFRPKPDSAMYVYFAAT